jgi:hypothetical protein
MDEAFVGIDVACAKKKRLPIVVCRRRGSVLEPLQLRKAVAKPPQGQGNTRILEQVAVRQFAQTAATYLRDIESEFGVRIRRVAIDAPSDSRPCDAPRRKVEAELDRRRISCIATPNLGEFEAILKRARVHLTQGGAESRLPGANQLWMLVGFELFRVLRQYWECLEVFPQAIAVVLGASDVHKSDGKGVVAQLESAARYTGWPADPVVASLALVGYGSSHDRLDAYLAAWVASLDEPEREPFGEPPTDVIWVPRLVSSV